METHPCLCTHNFLLTLPFELCMCLLLLKEQILWARGPHELTDNVPTSRYLWRNNVSWSIVRPELSKMSVVTTRKLNWGLGHFSKYFEEVVLKKQTWSRQNCIFTEACDSIYNVFSRVGICFLLNGCILICSSCQGLVSCTPWPHLLKARGLAGKAAGILSTALWVRISYF